MRSTFAALASDVQVDDVGDVGEGPMHAPGVAGLMEIDRLMQPTNAAEWFAQRFAAPAPEVSETCGV